MYNIIVCGMTGQGKSHFIKEYIKDKECYVFDVQNEYSFLPQHMRDLSCDKKHFLETCLPKRNTICVFEEATGFLEGRTEDKMRQFVVAKRHTGNVCLFVFHSLNAIPPRLMEMCNFLVLFKTNDQEVNVKRKFESLLPHFLSLRNAPKYSKKIIKLIDQ